MTTSWTTASTTSLPTPRAASSAGTMPTDDGRPARLYRMDTDGSLSVVLDGMGLSNGMGFTTDLKLMYYTDSFGRRIYAFDYDVESGELSNQRVFVEPS